MAKEREFNTFVSPEVLLDGVLEFRDNLTIGGNFQGFISSSTGSLTIDTTGFVKAEIRLKNIKIKGKVEGDCTAKDNLLVEDFASIKGDIKASNIIMGEQVAFEGKCKTISND